MYAHAQQNIFYFQIETRSEIKVHPFLKWRFHFRNGQQENVVNLINIKYIFKAMFWVKARNLITRISTIWDGRRTCKKHSLWQLINQKHTVRKCTCHASIYKVTLDSISKLNQECAWKPLSHLLNNPILMVWPSSAASTHVHDSTLIITVAHGDIIK